MPFKMAFNSKQSTKYFIFNNVLLFHSVITCLSFYNSENIYQHSVLLFQF